MYICLCHGITDRAIRQAAQAGEQTFEQLQASSGLATCCGACREVAETVWQDALSAEAAIRLSQAAQTWQPVL